MRVCVCVRGGVCTRLKETKMQEESATNVRTEDASHAAMPVTQRLKGGGEGAARTWLMTFSVAAFMPLAWIRCCSPLTGRSASSVAVP